jgi:hypothetical protein
MQKPPSKAAATPEHRSQAMRVGTPWLRHFFTQWSHNPQLMTPDDLAEYVRAYQQPGAIMGACNDYRAGTQDLAQD